MRIYSVIIVDQGAREANLGRGMKNNASTFGTKQVGWGEVHCLVSADYFRTREFSEQVIYLKKGRKKTELYENRGNTNTRF